MHLNGHLQLRLLCRSGRCVRCDQHRESPDSWCSSPLKLPSFMHNPVVERVDWLNRKSSLLTLTCDRCQQPATEIIDPPRGNKIFCKSISRESNPQNSFSYESGRLRRRRRRRQQVQQQQFGNSHGSGSGSESWEPDKPRLPGANEIGFRYEHRFPWQHRPKSP